MLLHTGACHEGFEFFVFPSNRDYVTVGSIYLRVPKGWCDFPPNGKFASSFNILLRMMLIHEWNQDLHIFSAISPEWVKPGDKIIVKKSPTYFGMVNLTAEARKDGIDIVFCPSWHEPPEKIRLHLPFFANVNSVLIDGCPVSYNKDYVDLPKQKCNINISWWIDPSINYSYKKAVEDYKEYYRELYYSRHTLASP
jgi:hypothetical protein